MSEKHELDEAKTLLSRAISILASVVAERQDAFSSRSENWQDSDKGEAHADCTSFLEDAEGNAQAAFDAIADAEQVSA